MRWMVLSRVNSSRPLFAPRRQESKSPHLYPSPPPLQCGERRSRVVSLIMASGLCNPANCPLRFPSSITRPSPASAAFVHAARAITSHLLKTNRERPRRRRWSTSGRGRGPPAGRRLRVFCGVTAIDQAEFGEKVLSSDVPVLVEFVADWCGPCRLISSAIEWASQEYKDKLKVVKIDHDANPQLIEKYKVYGLPTLLLFKEGQEVPESRREGAITKVKLKEYLDSLLESIAVA